MAPLHHGAAAPGPAAPRVLETCPLCGARFDAGGQGCRPSCPLAAGCRVVCCPSCGYSFPQEGAGLAGALARLIARRRAKETTS